MLGLAFADSRAANFGGKVVSDSPILIVLASIQNVNFKYLKGVPSLFLALVI
jgi:hypothetical protein